MQKMAIKEIFDYRLLFIKQTKLAPEMSVIPKTVKSSYHRETKMFALQLVALTLFKHTKNS